MPSRAAKGKWRRSVKFFPRPVYKKKANRKNESGAAFAAPPD
jgi:hypothetical protein